MLNEGLHIRRDHTVFPLAQFHFRTSRGTQKAWSWIWAFSKLNLPSNFDRLRMRVVESIESH